MTRDTTASTGDPGLYGPDSEAWRLNREALLLLGAGPRALLMQVAHPLIAEGVDQHSDFRSDPWARLRGTLRSYLTIVYGSTVQARAEIRRLNTLHRSIGGPVRDPVARERFGDAYDARDPDLSLWVHATLVESTIAVYDAWLEPLTRERRATYYAETRRIGRAFGIADDRLPADIDSFDGYVAEMLSPGGPVHAGTLARDLASSILHPPLGPIVPTLRRLPSVTYAWTLWPSVGLLPPALRGEYGLAWGPLQRVVATWLVAAWRGWRPLLPDDFRQMPRARAGDRRLGLGQ